jgi:hypothetical protein
VSFIAILLGVIWSRFLLDTGLRLSGDSAVFLEHAVGLSSGAGIEIPANRAPLYIFLINIFMQIQPWPTEAAALLAGISLTLVMLATGLLTLRLSKNVFLATVTVLLVATWTDLQYVFDVAWTEQLFTVFLVGHLLFIARYLERQRPVDLVLAGVMASGASLTRYMGVSLILVFGLYTLWLAWRSSASRQRYWAIGSALISALPLAGWLLRNQHVHGTMTGERKPSELSMLDNLGLSAGVLQEAIGAISGLGLLTVASLVAIALLRKHAPQAGRVLIWFTAYAVGLSLLYTAMVLWAATSVRIDGINTRYYAPVLPVLPVLVGAGLAATQLLLPAARKDDLIWTALRWFIPGILLAGTVMQLGRFNEDLKTSTTGNEDKPAHHTANSWGRSSTAQSLGAFLGEVLEEQDTVAITVLSHLSSQQSRTLLMRAPTFGGTQLELVGFRDWSALGYTIDLKRQDGQPVSVQYTMTAPLARADQLESRWKRVLDESEGVADALVIVSAPGKKELLGKKGFGQFIGDDLRVEELAVMAPYSILRLRRALPGEPPAEDSTGVDSSNPFATPGPWGRGVGWGTQPGGEDPKFSVSDGALHVEARAPGEKRRVACGPFNNATEPPLIIGEWKVNGVIPANEDQAGARLMVAFVDENRRWVKAPESKDPYWPVLEKTGNQDWTELKERVSLPAKAKEVRICVEVQGSTGIASFRSLRFQP